VQTIMTKPEKKAKRKNKKTKSVLKAKVVKVKAVKPSAKAKPKKVKITKKSVKAKNYLVVDYPKSGETIRTDYYTFRLGASPCQRVEVCLDCKKWQACRFSVGYWWFDWFNYNPGIYKLKARALLPGRKREISKVVQFKVNLT